MTSHRFSLTSNRLLGTKDLFEHAEHAHNARIGEPIMQGLGLAAKENESVAAQSGQMLRKGRLTEPKSLHQGADGHLTARGEEAQNDKPLLVREELQQSRRLICAVNNRAYLRQF